MAIKQFSTKDPINHWRFNFRERWKFGNFLLLLVLVLSEIFICSSSTNTRLVATKFRIQIKLPTHRNVSTLSECELFFVGGDCAMEILSQWASESWNAMLNTWTNRRRCCEMLRKICGNSLIKKTIFDVMTWFRFELWSQLAVSPIVQLKILKLSIFLVNFSEIFWRVNELAMKEMTIHEEQEESTKP
jgi:hypothetical protein